MRDQTRGSAEGGGDSLPARLLVLGFWPGAGGIARDMVYLINGWVGAGTEVYVLLDSEISPDAAEFAPGAHVDFVDLSGSGAEARLESYVAWLQPTAILSNRDQTTAQVVAAVARLQPRPRLVVRVGTDIPAKLAAKNFISRWRLRRRLINTYHTADLLVGVSDGACDGLRKLLRNTAPPIRRIYSPMDVSRITSLASEEPAHPWCKEGGGRLLISVGRLSRVKDHACLLRAFALLPGKGDRLLILGEGKQRRELEALAKQLGVADRVDFPGHASNPFAHVARADLFVLSSRFEGFGNALLEALIVGTPAVSTDCPSGPREILGGGRYGRLVPVGDPAMLAEAMLATIRDPPTPELLEEAVARLELDRAVPQYLAALGLTRTAQGLSANNLNKVL